MLKLYTRILRENDAKVLLDIADKVKSGSLKKPRVTGALPRDTIFKCNLTEEFFVFRNLLPHGHSHPFHLFISFPRTPFRSYLALVLSTFSSSAADFLEYAGVPVKYNNVIYHLFKASYQYYMSKAGLPDANFNLGFDALSIALIMGLSYGVEWLIAGCFEYNFFLGLLSLVTPAFISRFTSDLARKSLGFFTEALNFALTCYNRFLYGDVQGFDDDVNVEEVFVCTICAGIYRRPLLLDGFYFCDLCLKQWFETSNTDVHPYTASSGVSYLDAESDAIFDLLVRKYYYLTNRLGG